jgi:hypothetical protein
MAIPEGETINCRARKAKDCAHGKPSGADGMDPEGDGMCEDGTWDGESVVCMACYIAVGMPTNNANPGLVAGGKGTPGR